MILYILLLCILDTLGSTAPTYKLLQFCGLFGTATKTRKYGCIFGRRGSSDFRNIQETDTMNTQTFFLFIILKQLPKDNKREEKKFEQIYVWIALIWWLKRLPRRFVLLECCGSIFTWDSIVLSTNCGSDFGCSLCPFLE